MARKPAELRGWNLHPVVQLVLAGGCCAGLQTVETRGIPGIIQVERLSVFVGC